MKNYILTILILLASFPLFSQDTLSSNTSLEKARYLTERISGDLGIKSDKDQLFDILYIRSTGIEELKSLDHEEFLLEVNKINKETLEKLTGIFTPEQMAVLLELQSEKEKAKEDFKNANPNYTFTKEDEELDF